MTLGGACTVTTNHAFHPWYKVKDMTDKKRDFRIRKLTERECLRLMDVDEHYIGAMEASGVSRSGLYFAAGNSIVVACMVGIFENLFYPQTNYTGENGQLSLF